jgi:hypothetical protein
MVGMMMNDTVDVVVVVHWMGHTVITDLRLLLLLMNLVVVIVVVVVVAAAGGVQ